MRDSGVAIMGSAAAEGDNRAMKAVEHALESPLLNDNDYDNDNKVGQRHTTYAGIRHRPSN